jgi:PAS domain S-box-containing protein
MSQQVDSVFNRLAAPIVRRVPRAVAKSHVGLTFVLLIRLILALSLVSLIAFTRVGHAQAVPRMSELAVAAYVAYVAGLSWLWLYRRRIFASLRGRHVQFGLDLAFGVWLVAASDYPGSFTYYVVFAIPLAIAAWYGTTRASLGAAVVVLAASILADWMAFRGSDDHTDYLYVVLLRTGFLASVWGFVRIARHYLREQALDEARRLVQRDDSPSYLVRPDYSLLTANTLAAGWAAGVPAGPGRRCHEHFAQRGEPCAECPVPDLMVGHDVQTASTVSFGGPGAAAEVTAYRVLGHEPGGEPQAVRVTLRRPTTTAVPAVTADQSEVLALASTLGSQIETLVDIAVSVLGTEDRDLPSALRQIRERLSNVINVDGWYVALHNRQANSVVFPLFHVGDADRVWRERPWSDKGYTETVLASGSCLYVSDTASASQDVGGGSLGVPDEFACRCWAGVPLTLHGQVFGVMAVRAPTPGYYTPDDIEMLRRTSAVVAYAVVGVIRRQQLLDPPTHGDPYGLPANGGDPASDMLSAVLSPVLASVRTVIPSDTASLQLVTNGQLTVVAAEGWSPPGEILGRSFRIDEDVPNAAVYRSGEITFRADVGQHFASFVGHGPYAGRSRSWLGVPLKHRRSGATIAVMTCDKYDDPAFYGDVHKSIATVIAPVLADAMARASASQTRWVRTRRLTVVDLILSYLARRPAAGTAINVADLLPVAARLLADAFECGAGVTVSLPPPPRTVVAMRVGQIIQARSVREGEVVSLTGAGSRLHQAPMSYVGQPLGVVFLLGDHGHPEVDEEDLSVLRGVAGLIAPYVARAVAGPVVQAPNREPDMTDAIHRAIVIEDAAGIVRNCNAEFQRLVGAGWGDIVDRHFLSFVPETLRVPVTSQWQGRSQGLSGQYETVLLRADGGEVPVRVHARPILRDQQLQQVVVSFTSLTDGLYWALESAGRALREAQADTPSRVMQSVGAALGDCHLYSAVLHQDAPSDTMRIDHISATADQLKRLRGHFGIQFRGTSFALAQSPLWRTIVESQLASWWPDPRPLLTQVTQSDEVRRGLARYARLVKIPPAVVVPMTAHSGVQWVLVTWGDRLQRQDVAPLASFWRSAADRLTEADERTRNRRRAAPRTQLFRRRDRVADLVTPYLGIARQALGAERAALYGLRPAATTTYRIAADPPYPTDVTGPAVGSGAVRMCALTGIQRNVPDAASAEQQYLASPHPADADLRSVAALPIADNGLRLGVIELLGREPNVWQSDVALARLDMVQAQIQQLVQAAIRPGPAAARGSIGGLQNAPPMSLTDAPDSATLRRYVALVADMVAAEECSIWLLDEDEPWRLRRVASLRQAPNVGDRFVARIGTADGVGFTGYVAATGSVICEVGDGIRQNPKWQGTETEQFDVFATGRCDSVLVVPIPRPDGSLPALGVLKCENKLAGPVDPPPFTTNDRDQLLRVAQALAGSLPAWMERERRLRATRRDIGGIHRDRIHSVRSAISVTTNWGLQDLIDNWSEIDERDKQREIERAIVNLRGAAADLLAIEELVLRRVSASAAPANLPKLIRLKIEQFSLDRCTDVAISEDLMIEDDEVAAAIFDFVAEQLTNVCKYAQIDRDRPGQVEVRVTATTDEIEVAVRDHGVGVQRPLGEGAFRTLRGCVEPLGGTFEQPRSGDPGGGLEVRATLPNLRPGLSMVDHSDWGGDSP